MHILLSVILLRTNKTSSNVVLLSMFLSLEWFIFSVLLFKTKTCNAMLLHNKPDYSRTSEQTTVSPERHELAQHRCSGTVDSVLAQLTTTIHVDRTITKSSAMLPSDQTPIDTTCTRRFFAQTLQWPNVFKPAERCRRHPSRLTRPAQRTATWFRISLMFLRWCFKSAGGTLAGTVPDCPAAHRADGLVLT